MCCSTLTNLESQVSKTSPSSPSSFNATDIEQVSRHPKHVLHTMHTSGRNNVPREATSCSFSRSAVYRNARIDARIFVARKELIQKKSHVVGAQARLNSVTQFSPPCTTQHVSPHTLLLVPFAQISFLFVFTTKGKGDAVVSARIRESSRLIHTGFSRRHTPHSHQMTRQAHPPCSRRAMVSLSMFHRRNVHSSFLLFLSRYTCIYVPSLSVRCFLV